MSALSASIRRLNAFGVLESEGEITGTPEFVGNGLADLALTLIPGDTVSVTITCEVPLDHPLSGVDLGRPVEPRPKGKR